MYLLEGEHRLNSDADGEDGMFSEMVRSRNGLDDVNVVGVDMNLEMSNEIKVSMELDVQIQVLDDDDDSRLLDVEMNYHDTLMSNESLMQITSGGELNADKVETDGSHLDAKVSMSDSGPSEALLGSFPSSVRNENLMQRVSGGELKAERIQSVGSYFDSKVSMSDSGPGKALLGTLPSSVRNVNLMQRISGGELNAKRVETNGSHIDSKVSMSDSGLSKPLLCPVPSSVRNELIQRASGGELNVKRVESDGSQIDSKVSMSDEFSTSGPSKPLLRTLPSSVIHHYEVGDLVWGKVKSHPWWPGHIFSDIFASPIVQRTKRPGHFLVSFFGDSSYGWFPSEELVPFEPNFDEKSQQTNSINFVKAVEEAVDEIKRRCSMSLSCRCRKTYNFRPTKFQGYFSVDVNGLESGGIYSLNQIKKTRDLFQPRNAIEYIKMAAQMPLDIDYRDIRVIQNNAMTIAYRRSVYEEFDETYALAFGQKPVHPVPISQTAMETRAPLTGPLVISETMVKKKTIPNKPKEKYQFKQREPPPEPKPKPNPICLTPNTERPSYSVQPTSSQTNYSKPNPKKLKISKRPISDINLSAKSDQVGNANTKKKPKMIASGNQRSNFRELLHSLKALAEDPFHKMDINRYKTVKDSILHFQSYAYRPEAGPPLKQPKPVLTRPNYPTKAGKKREPSSHPIGPSSSKRPKKTTDVKPETSRPQPPKPTPRVREPTALVIKFPPNFSLPSSSELKARLLRFGPLDQVSTRIFYSTNTCRVVFLFKSDAMAANKHLSGTRNMFGNVQVTSHVRDVSTQTPESEPNKALTVDEPLKSCLKKPSPGKEQKAVKSRVKFLMGDEKTSKTGTATFSSHSFTSNTLINDSVPLVSNITSFPHMHFEAPGSSNVDISSQMLGLLSRCNHVVAAVRDHFGYVPYHSL